MFYTYMWLREDGTPYYVGKGIRNRAYTSWAHGVHCPAERERIVIYPAESEAEAFKTEILLIWYYGRKDLGLGCLRNLTNGGENPPKTKKGRRILRNHRKNISATLKRLKIKPPSRKGVPHTPEVRKRIGETQKLRRMQSKQETQ